MTAINFLSHIERIDLLCEQEELYTRDELVAAIRRICAESPSKKGVRCQTCHRIIPKEVSLQPVGDGKY